MRVNNKICCIRKEKSNGFFRSIARCVRYEYAWLDSCRSSFVGGGDIFLESTVIAKKVIMTFSSLNKKKNKEKEIHFFFVICFINAVKHSRNVNSCIVYCNFLKINVSPRNRI